MGEGGALPMSADPDPIKILTTDAEVAGWNSEGLPNDQVVFLRVPTQPGAALTVLGAEGTAALSKLALRIASPLKKP